MLNTPFVDVAGLESGFDQRPLHQVEPGKPVKTCDNGVVRSCAVSRGASRPLKNESAATTRSPWIRALERIRTSDLWYRKPALYPLSYEGGMLRGYQLFGGENRPTMRATPRSHTWSRIFVMRATSRTPNLPNRISFVRSVSN